MQPTIRRAEYKQFLRPDHFLACRYGCRHSTAAASNAGHLTCSTYGENSGRTVTDRTQEAQGQHGLTAMGTRGCDGTTDGEAPCRPATPTRHGMEAAGSRHRPPHAGTAVAGTALRSTKQRKLPGHLAMYKRLASLPATNLCSCMMFPTARNSTSLF